MNVSKMQATPLLLIGPLLAAVLLGGCKGENESSSAGGAAAAGGGGGRPAPQVEVVTVELSSPTWEQTYPGRIESMRRVQVRPRVSGMIERRVYEEGTVVKEGDPLFELDKEPFEVAAQRARANLASAQARRRQAERDWERVSQLFKDSALSERQRDDAQTAFELAQAEEQSAKAALSQAELDLGYATVKSPINGVTSAEAHPQGSLVTPQDVLTTVTQLDPIYVSFSLPIGDPAYSELVDGGSEVKSDGLTLKLYRRDGRAYDKPGSINFTESGVDPQTGTVSVRASFPNPNRSLLPGEFGRVAFENLKLPTAAIVPEKSVLSSSQGNIVYVIGEGDTVQPRPVTLGPLLEEGQMVLKGLNAGDRVITTALIRIRPGMTVKPVPVPKKEEGQATAQQ